MPSVFFISLMAGSPWGGSEELWYRTALQAAKKGWKVGCAVYHWKGKEEKMKALENAGASVHYLPNKGRAKKNLVERIQNKISKARVRGVIRSLPVNEYEVVVVNQGAFEVTTPAWRNFYRQLEKYIVLYHNYKEGEILKGEKKQAVQNWIGHARLNLFASGRIGEVLENNSGIQVSHADILINPVSIEVPQSLTAYPPLQDGQYRFVVLAALEVWRKAQDHLIQALSSEKWQQRNWTLHLYGEGKDKRKLQELISQNKLDEKVFLEGSTKEVRSVLQSAHVLLQLTHMDAMPLSVVEALAMGRPVAVTRIGDMPNWVSEGENGWVCDNASVEQVDGVLERAWQQRALWARMGANAYATFRRKFPDSAEENLLEKIESARRTNP